MLCGKLVLNRIADSSVPRNPKNFAEDEVCLGSAIPVPLTCPKDSSYKNKRETLINVH